MIVPVHVASKKKYMVSCVQSSFQPPPLCQAKFTGGSDISEEQRLPVHSTPFQDC